MRTGIIKFCFLIGITFSLFNLRTIYAQDTQKDQITYQEIDYDEIQQVIDDILGNKNGFSFGDYVNGLVSGEKEFSIKEILNDFIKSIQNEVKQNKGMILSLVTIAIIAAVFTNFSNLFRDNQVAETGFYITYLLLFSVLTGFFLTAAGIAGKTLSLLLNFMKVLIPAYFLAIAFSTGARTSFILYQSTLISITLVDWVLMKCILPLINIYFVLVLANNIAKEDMLSKLTELLETVIQWILKSIFGAVIGFHAVQGMIAPLADSVKKSLWLRAANAIPGIGGAFSSAAETIFSTGMLLKNAVGVAGLFVILLICVIPIGKLAVYALIYKFGVALVQPISDKRILNCVSGAANAVRLLLYMVIIGSILFFLTIAIITATTNVKI